MSASNLSIRPAVQRWRSTSRGQPRSSAIGTADYVLIPCMPDRGSVRETVRTAQQVASIAKAARRAIPFGVVLTRWKPRGLSERAALDSLDGAGLPFLAQIISDLTDYAKLTFSGVVPLSGRVGEQASGILAELVAKGAIPHRPRTPRAA